MNISPANNSQNIKDLSSSDRVYKNSNEDANEAKGQFNQEKITKEEVELGIEKLNEAVHAVNKDLEFKLHDKSGRMMVQVVNLQDHEVIKEMPPKETLDMLGRIKEMVGIIIDEKI
ncbi:hypothetical protein U472_03365 [Orenia metallireducens]|jgi:flagellar protein FlaG|uniref:Flagellar protein FlaG n=1 Tax=Orenia metallireducens TaxID=1413210 RepID=A0A1C0AB51_9FIRM|nr:flagellar protein FlaG [Orenia metallireducens]OCL27605.1 hypothetical protein U472_03365 [Orenia metallireducens]